jgi:thymidylate synthase
MPMISIYADTVDDLYVETLRHLMRWGDETHPRGFLCKELSPCTLILNHPQVNILTNPSRKASQRFMAAELLWILMGRNDVAMISHYLPKMKDYSDDGVTFFGAYGPKIMPQLPYVIRTLQVDPWSRQAILTIWRESPPATKDPPCTISMQFIGRPLDRLNLIVYMRSQDVWLGLPYDIHNFTCIQLLAASILGIKAGKLTIIQGSLHAYERDFEKIREAILSPGCSLHTPQPALFTIEALGKALSYIELLELGHRRNDPLIQMVQDPLLKQKIEWLIK